MSLFHHESSESVQTGLDLFSVWPTQTSIESGQYIEYQPLAALNSSSIIEFLIDQKSSGEYLDLANTFLHIQAKITNQDGTPLEKTTVVGPVNNFFHSLFSQVDISLNDTLVTQNENNYQFKAYIENTLNYDRGAKKSQLTSEFFYRDSAHKFEDFTQDGSNSGFKTRASLASESKSIDMIGKLRCDLMNMSRYLLNGVNVRLKLIRTSDAFNLLTSVENPTFKTVIDRASLFVRKVKLNPVVALAHNKALLSSNAKYPIKRTSLKSFSIPTGQLSVTKDNLFSSQLPTRVIIMFVDSDAYNGVYDKNPFNFKHNHLSYISLFVDGQQKPVTPLTPNFSNHQYARCYHRLFSELGLASKNEGNYIEYRDFEAGYSIFAFDLSPSILDGDQCELVKSGNLRLELKFSRPIPTPVHCLMYGELDSIIEITNSREIITDYSA